MTNESISNIPSWAGLRKRILIDGSIGLILISLFLFSAHSADPAWNRFWFIKPLIITPIATAMGGAFHFYVESLFVANKWNRALAVIIGTLGFIAALWMGSVLGLDGTYWD